MRSLYVLFATFALAGCAATGSASAPAGRVYNDVLWAEYSAEYQAICAQVYAQARRDLPRLLDDPDWTALPGEQDVAGKPPAIILDVDETVVSNADYQKTLAHTPYSRSAHFDWMRNNKAAPVRGAGRLINAAREAGVEVFFLTNRACERFEGLPGSCPYEQITIDDLREAGIETDAEHVLMAWEKPGWDKEKLTRREYVAETYRVIMVFGDDYSDFVPCMREKPRAHCKEPATRASRHAALETYDDYWGNGWYILPNPMHGSWTTVR